MFFSSNDETHAIINFSSNLTISMRVLQEQILLITIYEYVEKEEHDAKALFSGLLWKEVTLNMDTRNIEIIQ